VANSELQTVISMIRAADPMASGDLTKIREGMAAASPYRKPDDMTWQTFDAGDMPAEWTIPDDAVPGRAMFTGFSLGWLRTKENFFLSTPIEAVRAMPKPVQKLLGYETHGGIGVVDVGCPSVLL
jgi:hypothetical protein